MKKISLSLSYHWPLFLAIFGALLALIALYTYNLGSVGPPSTPLERAVVATFDSGKDFQTNILYAPHKLVGYGIFKLDMVNTISLRLVSVVTVFLSICSFFLVLKQWFSLRVASLTTALFASSSWMLFQARWAAPESMLLLVIPVALLTASLLKEKEHDYLIPVASFFAVSCLYLPGVWMLFLGGIVLLYGNIRLAWGRFSAKQKIIWLVSVILPLIPLIYGLTNTRSLRLWAGLPNGALEVKSLTNNLAWLPNQLLGSGLDDGLRWLPGTPIIDVATLGLALMGVIFVLRDNRYPVRRLALLVLVLFSLLLITLQGASYISLLLPLIYMFVAGGITFLLEQWFHVFPRNPLARSFGLSLLTILVVLTCIYQIARYHYVWPRAHETAHLFMR